jgi:hypothetical protein
MRARNINTCYVWPIDCGPTRDFSRRVSVCIIRVSASHADKFRLAFSVSLVDTSALATGARSVPCVNELDRDTGTLGLVQDKLLQLAKRPAYKAFQKRFGRSVKVRAPGMLVRTLERKAKAAGGELIEVTTRNTRLSQFDHTTGEYTKKPLSQREHVFGDGVTEPVQRDLYSAFLVFCCLANILDIRQVQKAWPSAEPLLRQAMSRFSQSASVKAQCLAQGVNTLRADRLSQKVISQCEVADAVAKARAAESSGMKLLEPPGFSHGEVQDKRELASQRPLHSRGFSGRA